MTLAKLGLPGGRAFYSSFLPSSLHADFPKATSHNATRSPCLSGTITTAGWPKHWSDPLPLRDFLTLSFLLPFGAAFLSLCPLSQIKQIETCSVPLSKAVESVVKPLPVSPRLFTKGALPPVLQQNMFPGHTTSNIGSHILLSSTTHRMPRGKQCYPLCRLSPTLAT